MTEYLFHFMGDFCHIGLEIFNQQPKKENQFIFKVFFFYFFFTFGSLKVYVPITSSEIFKSEVLQFLLKYFCLSIEYMSELKYDLLFYYCVTTRLYKSHLEWLRIYC